MLGRIFASYALFACYSLAELLTATREASDPTITTAPNIPIELLRKQAVGDRFIGWISIDGEWTSRSCDVGGTYFQSDEIWKCCATTLDGCNAPVGCAAGSLIYSIYTSSSYSYTTIACTEAYDDPDATSWSVCNTGLMYENTADFDPVTNIFCGASASRFTYYRVRPSESTSSSSEFSTPASTSAHPTDTSLGPADSATSTPSPTPLPQPTKPKSKAWIAGAVVGPIIGLALIGLLAWFLLVRRKKKTTPPPPPPPPPPMQQQQYNGPPSPYPGSPAQPPKSYYNAQKPPAAAVVPMGVASHQSWAAPPPHSPTSQGAVSPHVPPQNLYGQQAYPGPGQSPSPPNVHAYAVGGEGKPLGVGGYGERPFSAELDGGQQRLR
ncbi:uncharacterized protein CC84DRAFT_1261047 [Paraphaeosphaeria sporulosa]|uniref:Mid2 domain-containing protein n=1 Tax=Paraphaeosphaeria sporulosa TaxID=1460663 RepID=A0A177CB03_9PLEO|nr:uncharacterized protein CC84DRAFT_1261047 [Paraphaeosphaeria sporulosa]OAG04029.1 hypothetical protein CC84DRAFT_1261047 [Paraphaeosphaeria sporulosa]